MTRFHKVGSNARSLGIGNKDDQRGQPDPYAYEKDFITPQESAALFAACAKMRFTRRKTRNAYSLHQVVSFADVHSPRLSYVGSCFALSEAPPEINDLAARLTAKVGKPVNYLSVVLYEDGHDHMGFHQHKEDKEPAGRDMSVYIVSVGAARPFAVREVGGGSGIRFLAEEGSLITLSSEANNTHEHAVPQTSSCSGRRYGINCKSVADPGPQVYDCHAGKVYPKDAIYVGREVRDRRTGKVLWPDTAFGNHRKLGVKEFRSLAEFMIANKAYNAVNPGFAAQFAALCGKNLLCWCAEKEREQCHARIWLELANRS